MDYSQIRVEPVAGALGAEVSNVDLREPLDAATAKEIEHAWLEHQVLFFRDQPVTVDQHKAFARNFGELHIHPVVHQMKDEGHPEIVVLESDQNRPFLAERWHSDVTFEKQPPLGSVLHGVKVPAAGGDTMWSSMYSAYDALSATMQSLLGQLQAHHDGGGFRRIADDAQKDRLAENQSAVHPVIRTHPVTGRKAIFVNSSFTKSIEGMKPAESNHLLRFLFEHVGRPEFTVRFRWRDHSIAMWDNRCTQHQVVPDARASYRRMERVTICGDTPR